MDFELSQEQEMLAETAKRFVASKYSFERRREILASSAGWSRDVWRQLVELGLTALLVPAQQGGLGAGSVETMVVMNAFGAAMLLEPFWSSAVLATLLLSKLESATARKLLEQLASGERIAVVAHAEPGDRHGRGSLGTRAERTATGWTLNGTKSTVLHATAADVFLVTAGTRSAAGASVLAVPREAQGVTVRDFGMIDGRRAGDVDFSDVRLPEDALVGGEGRAIGPLEEAQDVALAAQCADTVGAMKALLDATRSYLQTRKQFGKPIGSFQALQHRIVDMLLYYEQAQSMSMLAAMQCNAADATVRRRALSAAKVVVGQGGRFVGQQAVQLHGGMGMSDELDVSHLFKRITAAELLMGDSDHHLQEFIALQSAPTAPRP
jgi:alkylation response protein AidB-like acyl-CoA dehydrogenase